MKRVLLGSILSSIYLSAEIKNEQDIGRFEETRKFVVCQRWSVAERLGEMEGSEEPNPYQFAYLFGKLSAYEEISNFMHQEK